MKIAFIVRNYHKRGGISKYVAKLAELYARDNEVHVYAASFGEVDDFGIKCHKVPILTSSLLVRWKRHAWNTMLEVWSFAITSLFMVPSGKYDLIHSQGDFWGSFDVYTAHSCHKAWLKQYRSGEKDLIKRLMKSRLNPLHLLICIIEKHNVRTAKMIVSVSKGVKEEIVNLYHIPPERIVCIPNGVDIEKFCPENKETFRSKVRVRHGVRENDLVMIFPAHEFVRKGLKEILDAMKLLNKDDIKLFVVGRDNPKFFMRYAEKLNVSRNVIFVGETSDIEQYYAASDIFVFPTSYEAFSLATLEAAASGLPLIITRVNGTEEIVVDGVDGFYVARNGEDVAGKISLLYHDRTRLREMSVNSRKSAEGFTWQHNASRLYETYRRLQQK